MVHYKELEVESGRIGPLFALAKLFNLSICSNIIKEIRLDDLLFLFC